MGRDIAVLQNNEKTNGINTISISAANIAPKGTPQKAEKNDHLPQDHILKGTLLTDESKEKQNGKISNHEPMEKIIEAEMNRSSELAHGTEKNEPAMEDLHHDQEQKMEPNLQVIARKQQFHVTKSNYEEEDKWSLASSTATSLRTTKVTVAVAPRFICVDRLERRKEFYSKLDEKHRALAKEKHDYQSRIKEEEQVAVKLLRKNMSYKANPVPSFYRDGPPPKVELKKLPVTRPKSPNLTRRKSCGDVVAKSSTPEKTSRHSIGNMKEAKVSLKNKARSHRKETIKSSGSERKSNADIAVQS